MDFILEVLYFKQSRCVQGVAVGHKFHRILPDCGQYRTPPSLLSTRMRHPSQREVCFLVLNFQLDRLRRSSSSSTNRFGGFTIMHACKHADSDQQLQLHTPIDRSSKTDMSISSYTLFPMSWRSDHTNCAVDYTQHVLGQCRVPISPIANWLLGSSLNNLQIPLYFAAEPCSETKFVDGVVP